MLENIDRNKQAMINFKCWFDVYQHDLIINIVEKKVLTSTA